MSVLRLLAIKISNYRSFGSEQTFKFPDALYKKPVAIVGYNNCGKTTLMNAILYGIGEKFVSKDTFTINDFHNLNIANIPQIELCVESSTETKYDGKEAIMDGVHKLHIKSNATEIEGARIESLNRDRKPNYKAFGASKYFNTFYINFHTIKDEISTQKTSWGNLKSFLAKHIKKLIESDSEMIEKKVQFEKETKDATDKVFENSLLLKFVDDIKKNYCVNLRDNSCDITFGLPNYEDIFLQMMFKVGLNGDRDNLIQIEHFGDGYISMFVMAVIQAIAESETTDKCLFLFEEPESFLHENHQEYFYKMVLCSLAERGHQVIYTTHSDKMVDVFETKSIIRLEFDETTKQTIKKYNNTGVFTPHYLLTQEETGFTEPITLDNYNNFLKSIEPNLNKILFSKKVLLVEGPNDHLVYNYVIEKKVLDLTNNLKFAQTYLNFLNIAIIVHHGKATALFIAAICKHFGLDFFLINDWDLPDNFVSNLSTFTVETDLKADAIYLKNNGLDRDSISKGIITTNWKLINQASINKIHFNIPKLEVVIGYGADDKDSFKIWKLLNQSSSFGKNLFPDKLEFFLEFNTIPTSQIITP